MTINFAIIYLVGLIIYRLYDGPLPDDPSLAMFFMASVVWTAGYIFLWIAKRYPLFGWALFGFLNGMLGGGRRRRW